MTKTAKNKLLIVESPAKAKTIAKYLGHEYRVLASVGHIRDLPKSDRNAIDIAAGFVPHYEIVKGKETVVENLRQAAKNAGQIVLATDPDREGEAIAWHIAETIGSPASHFQLPASKVKRIVFHEITEEAIKEALTRPREIDDRLRRAQEARRVLDRLFGYDLSGLIWRKLRYGLSAGRVQSPALRILVEREKAIRAFSPESYWVITAELKTVKGDMVIFSSTVEPKTEPDAEKILQAGRSSAWRVTAVLEEETSRRPRAPFTTSTLQQAASSRLGFSPSLTMRQAQRLYEAGQITYIRTDSTNLGAAAAAAMTALARQRFGPAYADAPRVYKTTSKAAQEAHEAIRPTDSRRLDAGHSDGEKKLYELIWRRALASQMSDARLMQTKITAECDSKTVPPFAVRGQRIIFDGWLAADPAARGEEVELPKVNRGEPLTLQKITGERKETAPPNRYSEAGLVKELEKRGIGRPSTYAAIIKNIIDRGYTVKLGRALQPTDTGETVSDFLNEHFADYVSDTFTAKMEDELDAIAAGQLDYVKSLKNFYGPFHQTVEEKKKIPKLTNLGAAPAEFTCPKCGGAMIWKLGRAGKFLSCGRFPDCDGARLADGKEAKGPKDTGEICPRCGAGKLIARTGRYGPFIACSNYPKCKFVKQDEQAAAAADTGVKCPICGRGTMAAKRGRYGIFYGCSNYPACKHIIKNKPTGKICGYLGSNGPCPHLMMEGTKTIPERCSDKTCPNHNPHQLPS
ncbi:MAG: type I DNA topoisomerase [Candidatus Vogelbacteria bacterium]|nr:type I DNA topoisomerase [Candidatus Vogelbacteria bacterium]